MAFFEFDSVNDWYMAHKICKYIVQIDIKPPKMCDETVSAITLILIYDPDRSKTKELCDDCVAVWKIYSDNKFEQRKAL